MKNIYLSIIIPCYNEERNIRLGALENMAAYLHKQNYVWEVLIVDDGSIDQSRQLINKFIKEHTGFRMIINSHQGKAGTVIKGIKEAKGMYVIFSDMDQATPINQLDMLLPYIKKGFEVVIGSRKYDRRGAPLTRKAMARGFMFLRDLILNLNISDTQCGFKMFSNEAASMIFRNLLLYKTGRTQSGSTVTAGFDVELLYIAKKMGYKIKEVPVDWHYQETRHINPIKDSLLGLMDLIKIRAYDLLGKYNR